MRICIVKLTAMGDIIHAMVALEFIKKNNPEIIIDWVVEVAFKGILENNPYIDNILPVNLKSIKKKKTAIFQQIKLVKKYSQNNYDMVIDAQGLIKSAIVSKILSNNIIVGFDKNSIREKIASYFYNQTISIEYHKNTITRNVKVLCEPFNLKITDDDILQKEPFLYFKESDRLELKKDYNLIVIGSTWESKNYPKEKFIEIVEQLKKDTYIVWGTDDEYEKALSMVDKSQYLEILPKVNLNTLKSVVANAKLLIGNDTGPTHLAWGLNIPSITIFGPTPINKTYPTPINRVIKSDSTIDYYKLDKQDFSIGDVKVSDIVKIAKELLK